MHLLLRSKQIAPKPRIARAPELVVVMYEMCGLGAEQSVEIAPYLPK